MPPFKLVKPALCFALAALLASLPAAAQANDKMANLLRDRLDQLGQDLEQADLTDEGDIRRLRNRMRLNQRRLERLDDGSDLRRIGLQTLLQYAVRLDDCVKAGLTGSCTPAGITPYRIDRLAAEIADAQLQPRLVQQFMIRINAHAKLLGRDENKGPMSDKQRERLTHLASNLAQCSKLRLSKPCTDQGIAEMRARKGLPPRATASPIETATSDLAERVVERTAAIAAASITPAAAPVAMPSPAAAVIAAPEIPSLPVREVFEVATALPANDPAPTPQPNLPDNDITEDAEAMDGPEMAPMARESGVAQPWPTPPAIAFAEAEASPAMADISPSDRLSAREVKQSLERIWSRLDEHPLPVLLPALGDDAVIADDLDAAASSWLEAIQAEYERIEDDMVALEMTRARAPADMDLSEVTRLEAHLAQEREPQLNYVVLQSLMEHDALIDKGLVVAAEIAGLDVEANADAASKLATGNDWQATARKALSTALNHARRTRLIEEQLGGEPTRDRSGEEAAMADAQSLLSAKSLLAQNIAATPSTADAETPATDVTE